MPSSFLNAERFGPCVLCLALGMLPCAGDEAATSPQLEKLAALEKTYETEQLKQSAQAFDAFMAGLTSLEESLRALGRQAAATRVANERKRHQNERRALQAQLGHADTVNAVDAIEASKEIVVDLSRAETKGGVVFDAPHKALIGWRKKEAEAVLTVPGVPANDYEIWLEYARLPVGRLRMRVHGRETRPALRDTESLDNYQFDKVAAFTQETTGDVAIVFSLPETEPREVCRLRRMELRPVSGKQSG